MNFTSSLDDNTNNIEEGTITYSWVNDNTNIGLAASGDGDISSFVATNGNGLKKIHRMKELYPTHGMTILQLHLELEILQQILQLAQSQLI